MSLGRKVQAPGVRAEAISDTAPSGGEAPCSALVAAVGGRAKVLHSVKGTDEPWMTPSGV